VSKTDARQGGDDKADARWAELIGNAQEGGPEAGAAARTLLEAFINGERDRRLTNYIARCLGQYLRGGAPIEVALHLSNALPPVVLGPAGEGDRRRAERASRLEAEGAGKHSERRRMAREQGDRGRNRRQAALDKAPDKRGRERPERRRKTAAPAPETD
jgi:hypothetical protein